MSDEEQTDVKSTGSGDGDTADYSFSDFEDNADDFKDDDALLAKDNDLYDSDEHALDHLNMEEIDDTDLQRSLAALPLPDSDTKRSKPEEAESTKTSNTDKEFTDGVKPGESASMTQEAWSRVADAKEQEETNGSDPMVVLEIDGQIKVVSNDDIQARDQGIGLSDAVECKASPSEIEDQKGQHLAGARAWETSASSSGRHSLSGLTTTAPATTSQSTQPQQSRSSHSLKPPSSMTRPFSSPQRLVTDKSAGNDAFTGWLASKNKTRAKSVSVAKQKQMKDEAEKRRKEAAEQVFAGWLASKREGKMKEKRLSQQQKEELEEELRQKEVQKELSKESFEVWCSQKERTKRRHREEKQMMEDLERERTITISPGESDAAYREWLRKKDRDARKQREWLAARRREHVQEARELKKSLAARYTTRL